MIPSKNCLKIICALVLFFFFSGLVPEIHGEELTAEQIVEKVNELMVQESVEAKFKMTIITTSGQERTFVYDSFSKNKGEKNLIRYLEPKRVKGQAILMLNNADDIWAYFPRTKRVRKLATHAKRQKMEGSDFSYEDMGAGNTFAKDFNSKKLGREKKERYDCYKLEMTRKEGSDVGYSRLIIWVIKENFFPVVIDYYDENNPEVLVKSLVQSNIKEIDGIPTGMQMIMYDKQNNTQTSMEIIEIRYNIELEDAMFTERGLRK